MGREPDKSITQEIIQQLKKYRDDYLKSKNLSYYLIILLVLLTFFNVIILIRYVWHSPPKPFESLELAQILLGAVISLIVAVILQFIRDFKYLNIIKDSISDVLSNSLSSSIREIIKVKNQIIPHEIFSKDVDNLRKKQIEYFSNAEIIKFMSISAVDFIGKSIPRVSPIHELEIKLLLLDPGCEDLLKIREEQLNGTENKKVDTLRKEIIITILNCYEICKKFTNIKVFIKFHQEIPFCRIELADGNLYLSYYKSQISADNKGPVSIFDKDSDIHKAYSEYFSRIWYSIDDKKKLSLHEFENMCQLKQILGSGEFFQELESIITSTNDDIKFV